MPRPAGAPHDRSARAAPHAAVARLGTLVTRRAWTVVVLWLVALALLAPLAARVESRLEVAARVPGSESEEVARRLAREFASPFAQYAVLVVTGIPAVDTPAGTAALGDVLAALDAAPGVARTFSWRDTPDPVFRAEDGTFIIVGLDAAPGGADALVAPLRARTAPVARALGRRFPRASLAWTGEAMLNHDLRIASAADAATAERRVLPLTVLLLVVAFGSLVAAFLPVAMGALTIVLASGVIAALARIAPLSVLVLNVVSMLGLGLGIDYALLAVGRFREARARGLDARAAAEETAARAGPTIAVSAATVAIGLGALLAMPLPELRSIGAGGLVVTLIAAALALTLVPALLAVGGRHLDRVALPARLRPASADGAWRAVGAFVVAHPWRVLVLAGAPVVLLAWQARRLSPELPRGDWLPPALESARGVRLLQAMERSGVVQSVRVVVRLPAGTSAWDSAGWHAASRIADRLRADGRIARVRALPVLAGPTVPGPVLQTLLPADVRAGFVSRDERSFLVEAMPREGASPRDLSALVRELRATPPPSLTGVPGAAVLVGGLPAFNADYADAVAGRGDRVVALVVGATLLALALAFRSPLVALKAVVLNLLSVGGALGVVVLVFQDGWLAAPLGLTAPLDGTFPAVLPLVFCLVFGLSMDYEVFLVARVAEARREGLGDHAAIAEGVARTGGVITSAASVMLVVFAAFALGDFVLMQILGVALAAAVLLDATVVRLAIGPALLAIAGRWNWWPGDEVAPRVSSVLPASAPRPLREGPAAAPGR